jgi:hypothetical protein
MKKLTLIALTVGAIFSAMGTASAQVYLDIGPNAGPRYRDYDEPRYRDRERYRGERYRDYDEPRYRDRERYRERYGDRRVGGERGYYRPGGYKTFNGCQTAGPSRTVSANHIAATKAGALY